jgi:cystathionine beta-lyase
MMDNTWASPLFFKPFEHGVDVSVQAATKYIVGHSDAMLGTATATAECLGPLRETVRALGYCAGPDDAYLGQRGLRTLGVRLRQHQESGLAVARWIQERPEVIRVMHPGLPSDPGHEIWRRDFTGASGLFGFVMKSGSRDQLAAFVEGCEHFGMGGSWGGYESLCIPTSPEKSRTATEWAPGGQSMRLHIGLEDADDLIEDLDRAFARFRKAG